MADPDDVKRLLGTHDRVQEAKADRVLAALRKAMEYELQGLEKPGRYSIESGSLRGLARKCVQAVEMDAP